MSNIDSNFDVCTNYGIIVTHRYTVNVKIAFISTQKHIFNTVQLPKCL